MKKCLLFLIFQSVVLFSIAQTGNPFWENYASRKVVSDISFQGDTAWVTSEGGISNLVSGSGLIENFNTINSELTANNIYRLVCSRNHGLWFTPYPYSDNALYHVKNYNMTDPSMWDRISFSSGFYGMTVDRNDDLLFFADDSSTTPNQIKLYRTDGNTLSSSDSVGGYHINTSVIQLFSDYDKNAWIRMGNKILKENSIGEFDFIDSTFANGIRQPLFDVSPDSTVWALIDSPTRLAKLTPSGWVYYDSTSFGLDNLYYNSQIRCDKNGNVWALCNRLYNTYFLLKFDGINWTTYDSISAPILNEYITKIEVAPNGNLWCTTARNGVYEFDGNNWMQYDAGSSSFLRSYVKKVDFDKNNGALILGGNGRLYQKTDTTITNLGIIGNDLAVDTNGFPWTTRYYSFPPGPVFSYFDGSSWQNSAPDYVNGTSMVACDRNNVKWIGSSEYGLIKFTDSVEAIYSSSNSPLSSNDIYYLFCDSKENVWIFSYYTLQKFDGTTWTTWYTSALNFPIEVPVGLTEDKFGNVWTWARYGSRPTVMAKYDGSTWTPFNPPAGFPSPNVNSLAFDHNNNLWASFSELGLGKFDGNSWIMITPDNSPLPLLRYGPIKFDRYDNLFICDIYEGLTIFNPDGIQYNNPVPTSQRVSGQIFHDVNSNASFDSTEMGLNNQRLLLLPDSTIITTNSAGKFVQNLFAGDYEIQVLPFPGWNVTTDSLSYHFHVDSSSISLPDFGLNAAPFHSVEINHNVGMLYCGYDGRIWINYTNTGSIIDSGEVILKFDTIADYYSGNPIPNQINDSIAVWKFSNFMPFETRTITADLYMAYLPNLIFSFTSEVNLKEDTMIVASDSTFQSDSVLCYDDELTALMSANPIGNGSQHIVNVTDTLYYTLNFQNTTHDSISYLSINDTLDMNFDLSSFRIISSSHAMNYSFNSNVLTFSFPNINLPDTSVDFLNSQGYITFSVVPINTTPHLTVIQNSAQVSYDYSAFVQSNEVFNTIYRNGIGIDEISNSSLKLFPNPANSILNVVYSGKREGKLFVEITDILGRKVSSEQLFSNESQIDLSRLISGFYIVSIVDSKAGKLVSERLVVHK